MAGDYAEIVMQAYAVARGAGVKNVFNVFHYHRVSGPGNPSKGGLETSFQANVGAAMLAVLNIDYTQVLTTVRWFDDALDAPQAFTEAGVGAITGDRMETFVAATIQLKTATRGRFARGSKHLAPMSESQSVGDVWNSGTLTLLTSVGTAMLLPLSDLVGNSFIACIRSSKAPAQYKTNPVTIRAYDCTGFVVNHTAGTMRRRKVKTVT